MTKTVLSLAFLLFVAGMSATATPYTFRLGIGVSSDDPVPEVTVDVVGASALYTLLNYQTFEEVVMFSGNAEFVNPGNPRDRTLLGFSGSMDADAAINWAATALTGNFGKSISFSYKLTPLAPGVYSKLTAGFNGSMGDLRGDGVAVTGLSASAEVPVAVAVPAAAFLGGCVKGKSSPATNWPCPISGGQFGPISAFLPPAYYPSMQSNLSFYLSSHDSATFNGQLIVEHFVPEPATMALIGCGLLGMAALVRRRARTRK